MQRRLSPLRGRAKLQKHSGKPRLPAIAGTRGFPPFLFACAAAPRQKAPLSGEEQGLCFQLTADQLWKE